MAKSKFRWLKITGIVLIVLVLGIVALVWIKSKPMPLGETGPAADQLAQKMLTAINNEAWEKTGAVQWTFAQRHQFIWDRKRHFTEVSWDDYRVLVDINRKKGIAYQGGKEVSGEEGQALVIQAWEFWANDSFWLNAPAKVFDGGTSRHLVKTEDGKEALLVKYSSGGVTPGDAYLWELDEQGLPQKYSMWVSIIPVKGMEASWANWKATETGAKISTEHDLGIFTILIEDLKTASDLSELTEGKDIFSAL